MFFIRILEVRFGRSLYKSFMSAIERFTSCKALRFDIKGDKISLFLFYLLLQLYLEEVGHGVSRILVAQFKKSQQILNLFLQYSNFLTNFLFFPSI